VPEFRTVGEAKEFLISRLVLEAERDAVPLSEVEVRMLHFSATEDNSSQVLEASERFDLECDREAYETKILTLSRRFQSRARQAEKSDLRAWTQAVGVLRREDHYLAVLIDPGLAASAVRPGDGFYPPWHRLAKLILIGFVAFLVMSVVLLIYLRESNTH
jgi:hypothetical protein